LLAVGEGLSMLLDKSPFISMDERGFVKCDNVYHFMTGAREEIHLVIEAQ
jgi:hypothetical protein